MYSILVACSVPGILKNVQKYVPTINPDIRITPAATRKDAMKALNSDPGIEAVVCENGNGLDAFGLYDDICKSPSITRSFIMTTGDPDITKAVRAFEYRMDFVVYHDPSVMSFYVDLAQKIVISCERRRAVASHDLDSRRKDAVITLANLRDHPFSEALNYALETSVELTGSEIGYVATYTASTRKLNIIAWSVRAMGQCKMINRPMEYNLDESGLWGEPIRLMKTVRVDDYASENVYQKNGLPAGHVQLRTLLMVPIVRNGVPVATAGVANKETPYTDEDAAQLRMLMDSLISIYQENLFKDESRNRDTLLGAILNTSPYGILFLDRDLRIKACSKSAELLLGIDGRIEIAGSLKDLQNNEAAKGIMYAVTRAYADNTSINTFLSIDHGSATGRYDVSVDIMLDSSSQAEACLVSIIDMTMLSHDAAPENSALKRTRMIADTVDDTLSSLRPDIAETASVSELERFDEVLDYMGVVKRLGSAAPVWQRVKSCIPTDTEGIDLDADIGPVNVLADQTFDSFIRILLRFSKRSGASRAELDISLNDRGAMLVYTDDGEGVPDSLKRAFSDGASLGLWAESLKEIASMSGFGLEETGIYGKGIRLGISIPADKVFIGKTRTG